MKTDKKPLGNIDVEKLRNINYYEIFRELINANMTPEAYDYYITLPEVEFLRKQNTTTQRFMLTRIFIRHLFLVRGAYNIPSVPDMLTNIKTMESDMEWLGYIQKIIIPYFNEYGVFEKVKEILNME